MSETIQTLQERIDAERITKSTANPRSLKQLAKNPNSINTQLTIQRNLRWSSQAKSNLIESVLLGYPIPPVFAIKSNDNVIWILDGKQRITTFVSFLNDEWALEELQPVFGIDITGMKFSELPEEFKELLRDHNIVFYQFERLTVEQRDSFFQRLNSGVSLTSTELTRAILGSDNLQWINSVASKMFFNIITEKGRDKFLDVEIVMQMLGVLKEQYEKLSGKDLQALALEFRINGISDELKRQLESIVDYIGDGYGIYDEKMAKKLLKKNDIIGLTVAAKVAIENEVNSKVFAVRTGELIQKTGGAYKNTKTGGTNKGLKVRKRIELLTETFKDQIKEKPAEVPSESLEESETAMQAKEELVVDTPDNSEIDSETPIYEEQTPSDEENATTIH